MSSTATAPKRKRRGDNVVEHPTAKRERSSRSKASSVAPADFRKPPAWLSKTAREAWAGLVEKLDEVYPEELSALDVPALALMVEHYATAAAAAKSMRDDADDIKAVDVDEAHRDRLRKAPASQVMRDHAKAFLELAREYGLTLKARAALGDLGAGANVPDDDEDDDLFER